MQPDQEKSEEEIVDNYRTDTLYTHKFKNEAGKYFTIVSRDENNVPDAIEAEHPYPIRNKIKTTFTFIKENNKITQVSFKRMNYPAASGRGIQWKIFYILRNTTFLKLFLIWKPRGKPLGI